MATERKKRKPKFRMLRFRKGDVVHNLYAAAQHFIHAKGGNAIIMGGVEVQEWPTDLPFIYRIAVRVTGRKPDVTANLPEKKPAKKCGKCGQEKWRCTNNGHRSEPRKANG